ncbi:MAG: hypothetical protein IE931_04245 [Sphingobacteriales bacterium]|nr:hypothetical protein [Sphingobacteriales bacterium]
MTQECKSNSFLYANSGNSKIIKGFFFLTFFLTVFCTFCSAQSNGLPIQAQYVQSTKPFIFYASGDGGMNNFSERLIKTLNQEGYATVALNTRKYFWSAKTPQQFAQEIQPVIQNYLKMWHKDRFYLIGYSFGADVSAFLPNDMNPQIVAKIISMILISPGYSTDYEVKLMDMMRNNVPTTGGKYQVYPELVKANKRVLCIFGSEENSDFYSGLKETSQIRKVLVAGSHHYEGDMKLLFHAINKGL